MKIVIDTYAWIEVFLGTEKGRKAVEIIRDADEVYTPSIVLAEISKKYAQSGYSDKEIEERIRAITRQTRIVKIDERLALLIAKAYRELIRNYEEKGSKGNKPGVADAIILASAWKVGGKILTGDAHFKDMELTIWIGD